MSHLKVFKNITEALAITTIFCVAIGGTILVVQHVEAHGVVRAAVRMLQAPAVPSIKLFTDRAIQPALVSVLESLQPGDKVLVAAYAFTDPTLAEILIQKYRAGVGVEMVADSSGLRHEASQITYIAEHIPIHCYPALRHTTSTDKQPLQHNKFIVIVRENGVSLVATGSYNFTRSAACMHSENCIVVEGDAALIEDYQNYFETLKSKSTSLCDIVRTKKHRPIKKLHPEIVSLIAGGALR